MGQTLSVITPCYNDFDNFSMTLASLISELMFGDELVIVDSSDDREKVRTMLGALDIGFGHKYVWMAPGGVYAAQNRGIHEASGDWIQIINAGDCLLPKARSEIDKAIGVSPAVNVHVFRQLAVGGSGPAYVFTPTKSSIWPHQSIIVQKSVYMQEGTYSESYRYGADQIYFASIRRSKTWKLNSFILTSYLLGGLSASISLESLREIYQVRRALGHGYFNSGVTGFIFPVIRRSLQRVFGATFVSRVQSRIFLRYAPIKGAENEN